MTDPTTPADKPAKLLDVQAVAAILACSPRHVYRLTDAGKMPSPLRVGSLVRWSKASIEDWVAGGCKPLKTAARKGGRR